MKITLKSQRTLDGLTYAPQTYVVGDHDPANGSVNEETAKKLLSTFPVVCAEVKPRASRAKTKTKK
jgi:hypothetical protein